MNRPELGTHNGTGVMLLGLGKQDEDGAFWATAWDVTRHLPIRPRSRHKVRVLSSAVRSRVVGNMLMSRTSMDVVFLDESPVIAAEVRMTRLWHYLIFPLVVLAPLLLCIPLWGWLGDTAVGMHKKASQGQAVGVVVGVVWLSLVFQIWLELRNKRVRRRAIDR